MTLDSSVLWDIAEKLHKNSCCEEEYRSSTNRAYYSAYHVCSIVAKKYKIYPKNLNKGFKHSELSEQLIANKTPYLTRDRLRKLGYMLKQAKSLRVKADYKTSNSFTYNQSDTCLSQTKAIINLSIKL
jgi:uncharacterized protein (UPF0332 family)